MNGIRLTRGHSDFASYPAAASSWGHVKTQGIDPEFIPYARTSNDLHYRNLVDYAEMLDCIGRIDLEKLKECLLECVVFSIQLDVSISKQMKYNRFISCRVLICTGDLQTFFLHVSSLDSCGAAGILEVIKKAFRISSVQMDKIYWSYDCWKSGEY